jgi:hypothetical protein
MKMKSAKLMLALLLVGSSAAYTQQPAGGGSAADLARVAKDVFGVEVAPKPVTEMDENLIALRTPTFTVAQRTDCRTYFVRNHAYGPLSDEGVFNGSDDDLRKTAARILTGLGIDPNELAREKILTVQQGAGEFDDATGQAKADAWESKQRVLVAGRQVGGVPIFSSRLFLALTAKGAIGRLKLHWPTIPAAVLEQAKRYQQVVREGFKPPAAHEPVASITAGVIHSSPRSRLLDMMAAIRVEYATPAIGKARVVYLNADGQPLRARHDEHSAPPRQHKKQG